MLLKFTAADMLNTSLIDVTTGESAYDIVTVLFPPEPLNEKSLLPLASGSSSSLLVKRSSIPPASKHSSCSTSPELERRQTRITDAAGKLVVDITWNGRHPDITIGDEKVGGLPDLFGSSTIRFMPKILCLPTRFDTEYIWTATPDSLTIFDYDSELTRGKFHQNVIRIPASRKSSQRKMYSASSRHLPQSAHSLGEESQQLQADSTHAKSTFIQTHVPGLGSNYLEFKSHPLAQDVEIIISFIMMEILRRGRFCLTPYTFEKPKLWQFKEAKDLVMRRIRRNTI